MELSDEGDSSRLGLSASNIFSSSSDPELARRLVLARIERVLKSPKHSRETMLEFKSDWDLLRSASLYSAEYRAMYSANIGASPTSPGTRHGGDMLFTRK